MADTMAALLGIRPGVTAIIGSGGKTTLMGMLGRELCERGRVILSTSTHILPPEEGIPVCSGEDRGEIQRALDRAPMVCVGAEAPHGKLQAPGCGFSGLAELADFVLVEADGSRGYPIKAHAPWEPVIPPESNQVLLVVGAAGFGRPLAEVCHRPEIFSEYTGLSGDDPVLPEHAARVILQEGYAKKIIINQVESPADWSRAAAFAACCPLPVFAGSLQKGELTCL